jgi:HlyD family secretion protein
MKALTSRFVAAVGRRRKPLFFVLVAAIAVSTAAMLWGNGASAKQYATASVERGSVELSVAATGTVQPVKTVQVGSQASGTISWIGVDFNSPVKKGQVIARLDPATVETQIENARASVASAQAALSGSDSDIQAQKANIEASRANVEVARAQRDDAEANAQRLAQLANVVAAREIEAARAEALAASARYSQAVAQLRQTEAALQTVSARRAQSNASLSQANAQLRQVSVSLDHTVITSPIDGVVVSRDIDVGQTVAASLQAPTLFTIADDLSKMQVLAAVDEADVGQLREGLPVTVTVDAFSNETFAGNISQVRLNATTTENVVTYTAVVAVNNPSLKLRPGMTANVTISIAKRDDVLTVPNSALRFRPSLSEKEQSTLREATRARRSERANASEGGTKRESRDGSDEGGARERQTVWVQSAEGKVEPRRVKTGLSDGRVSEILEGDLSDGDVVLTGEVVATSSQDRPQQNGNPFGPQRYGGSGRSGRSR